MTANDDQTISQVERKKYRKKLVVDPYTMPQSNVEGLCVTENII